MKHWSLLIVIISMATVIGTQLQGCSTSNPCLMGTACNALECGTVPYEGSFSAEILASGTINTWDIDLPAVNGTVKITSSNANQVNFTYKASPGKTGTDCFSIAGSNYAVRLIDFPPQDDADFFAVCYLFNISSPVLIANPLSIIACENEPTTSTVTASGSSTMDTSHIRFANYTGVGGLPSHGSLGSPAINPITGSFTYTPNTNYTGPDSFIFTVTNTLINQVASNTVTIFVDQRPTTNSFTFNSCQGALAVGEFNVSGGLPAYSYFASSVSALGVPINQPSGAGSPIFTYQPNVTGADLFLFQVSDGAGCSSNISTASTNVSPPLVAGPVSFTTCSNQVTTHSFSASGGHPGSYQYAIPSSGSGSPKKGTVVINAGGTFTYTPFAGTSGADNFIYSLGDGTCDAVTNIITANINRAPELVYQPGVSVCENNRLNDTVSDDSLSQELVPTLVSGPSHGTVSLLSTSVGFDYTYNPATGYIGPDSFIFSAFNSNSPTCSATGIVNITVLSNPVAGNISVTGCGTSGVTGVLAPTGGSGSYPANQYTIYQPNPANGRVVPNSQYPDFDYIPTVSFSGPDLFFYSVKDTNGCISPTGTVNIFIAKDVEGIAQSLTGCVGTAINGRLMATGGAGSYIFGIAPSQNDDLIFTTAPINLSQGTITAFNSNTGSFTYKFTNTTASVQTFYFVVFGCPELTFTPITISPVLLQVNPISFSTCSGGSYTNNLTASDGSGTYNFTYLNGPSHGTLNPFNASTGLFVYSPTSGYAGLDGFSYQATDVVTGCESNIAPVVITVLSTHAPTVSNLTLSGCFDGTEIGNFTASGGSGNYEYMIITGPTHGTLPLVNPISGEFVYQSLSGFTGIDSFTYNVTDLTTGCMSSLGTVTITVGCS